METEISHLKKDLERISKTVYGNGKPGLVDKMNDFNLCSTEIRMQLKSIIDRFDAHEEEFHNLINSKSETLRWLITAAIAAFSAVSSFFR